MLRCGLLGEKLGHSWSPEIHGMLGDYEYRLYERAPVEVADFLQNGAWDGLNVTVPYKKTVVPFCDELTETAKRLGSVNTLVRHADGTVLGDNTDVFGFEMMLATSGLSVKDKKVLVLGSGGASVTVSDVLRRAGAEVVIISRTGENHYGNLFLHKDARLVVNTTPVGMYPNNGNAPLSLEHFPDCEGVLDIIYNPLRTALLCQAEARGLVAVNGLSMLVAQAVRSSERFTGTPVSESEIGRIFAALRQKSENIVLIGMAGCGKTTVGEALSRRLNRPFVDTDLLITEKAGKPIPEIFAQSGEEVFRRLESDVIKEVGKRSGLIIATGGGCVTRPENYEPLHQNGKLILLWRDPEKLSKEGRPLSQKTDPAVLWVRREECYRRFADGTVDNNGTVVDTVQHILEENR